MGPTTYTPAPALSGHLPDGSSVQRHSAGSHFPFVVGYQEGKGWYIIDPRGEPEIGGIPTAEAAYAQAEQLAAEYRSRQTIGAAGGQVISGAEWARARARDAAAVAAADPLGAPDFSVAGFLNVIREYVNEARTGAPLDLDTLHADLALLAGMIRNR